MTDPSDEVFDSFDSSSSEQLTARTGWNSEPLGPPAIVRYESDEPGVVPLEFWREWMVAGGTYAVRVVLGEETYWEKIDDVWTRRE